MDLLLTKLCQCLAPLGKKEPLLDVPLGSPGVVIELQDLHLHLLPLDERIRQCTNKYHDPDTPPIERNFKCLKQLQGYLLEVPDPTVADFARFKEIVGQELAAKLCL